MQKDVFFAKNTKIMDNNRIGNKNEGRRKDTKDITKRWSGDGIY